MACNLWQNIMLINKYRRRLNDNRIDEKFAHNDEKITIEYKGDYRKGLAENR